MHGNVYLFRKIIIVTFFSVLQDQVPLMPAWLQPHTILKTKWLKWIQITLQQALAMAVPDIVLKLCLEVTSYCIIVRWSYNENIIFCNSILQLHNNTPDFHNGAIWMVLKVSIFLDFQKKTKAVFGGFLSSSCHRRIIIIITVANIKVTLSHKCCRGTVHKYGIGVVLRSNWLSAHK